MNFSPKTSISFLLGACIGAVFSMHSMQRVNSITEHYLGIPFYAAEPEPVTSFWGLIKKQPQQPPSIIGHCQAFIKNHPHICTAGGITLTTAASYCLIKQLQHKTHSVPEKDPLISQDLPTRTTPTQIPPWAEHAQTVRSCLLGAATDDTSIDFTSDEAKEALDRFYQQNPNRYDLLTQFFLLPPAELTHQLKTKSFDAVYNVLDFAVFVDLQGDFISRLSDCFAQKLYESLQMQPQETLAFLATANKDLLNRHVLAQMQTALDDIWIKPNPLKCSRIIKCTSFNHDNSQVVTPYQKKALIWDTRTGNLISTLSGHTDLVGSAQFSPDGSRVVTTSDDKTARIWDATTGINIYTLPHTQAVNWAEFTHNGSRIVTLSNSSMRVWNASTGALIYTLKNVGRFMNLSQSIRRGAHIITAGNDGAAYIWNVDTGTLMHTLTGHTEWIRSAQFNHDNTRVITISSLFADKFPLRIWDATTGSPLHAYNNSVVGKCIDSAKFNHDGTRFLIVAKKYGFHSTFKHDILNIHDVSRGTLLHAFLGNTTSKLISHDGSRIATISDDDTTYKIWDAHAGTLLHTLIHPSPTHPNASRFNHDSSRFATASRATAVNVVYIWNTNTGTLIHTLISYTRSITSLRFSPDSSFLITTTDKGKTFIWRIKPLACSLAQALLIKLIAEAKKEQKIFDFSKSHNKAFLPSFKTLDPAWQRVLLPLVRLPLSEQVARACTMRNLAICGTAATTAARVWLMEIWSWIKQINQVDI